MRGADVPSPSGTSKDGLSVRQRWGHFLCAVRWPRYLAALIRHLRGRLSALSLLCCSGLTLLLRLSVLR